MYPVSLVLSFARARQTRARLFVPMLSPRVKTYLSILALYTFLALVLTYPLALHFTNSIPGHDTDGPAQTWSLWWTRFAILDLGRAPFTTDYLFYPLGLNLVAYTPAFLNGILSIPFQEIFGVIISQNLMVLFALVTGAFGAYLFVGEILAGTKPPRSTRGSCSHETSMVSTEAASILAGALYGFGAWHLNYVVAGHFMLISNQWLPYYALYLIRLERGKLHDAIMLGLFLVLTTWTELTFAPFLSLLTFFYLIYLLIHYRREIPSRFFGKNGFALQILIAALITAVGISPLILSLVLDFQRYGYYLTSGVGRIQIFSAELISFFLPSVQHPILGVWSNSITTANTSYAFIGWAALLLALIGLVLNRASAFARFWGIAALLFALLMLGSTLYVNGVNTNIPMPFALLRLIPFVNANRYPARFNVMLMLALAPLFAYGVLALWDARRRIFRVALAALVVLLVFEQLVLPIPLTNIQPAPVYASIGNEPGDFTVLELPLGWRGSIVMQGETDDVAQFFQTTDHKRRLGGITSRFPDFKLRYFARAPVLRSLIAFEEGRAVSQEQLDADRAQIENALRFFDIHYISMNRAQTAPETLSFVRDNFPITQVASDAARIMYRVNPLPPLDKWDLDPASDLAQLVFDDLWGHGQADNAGMGYRWAVDGSSRIWLPLDAADYDLTFHLRGAHPDQKISLRVNGNDIAQWTVSDQWQDVRAHVPQTALRDGLDEIVFTTDLTPLANVTQDRTIGGTGVVSPVDISATGAGFDAGKYGEIFVAGRSLIDNTRGYHLVSINPQTGQVDAVRAFDTFGDDTAAHALAEFVATLPQGEIVAGVAVDDASQKLKKEGFAALQSLGVSADVRKQFRAGHAFIGIKGIAPGQAIEDVQVQTPATVAVGSDVTRPNVAFALGPFTAIKK